MNPRLALALALALPGVLPALAGEASQAADPWTAYNSAVKSYAAHQYEPALEQWLDLSARPLPRSLRQPVSFQMGNAQFRLGEPLETSAPEQAAELWRRSCESYRAVLRLNRRHAAANQNLALVEKRLARLTFQLGAQLHREAAAKPLDDAINTLKGSVEYLEESVQLAPADTEIRQERDAAMADLQRRLLERSQQSETQADQSAAQRNTWSDTRAEQAYRDALADADEAKQVPAQRQAASPSPTPLDRAAQQAHDRVTDKLSKLLTRMGQGEQQSAEARSRSNPEEALDQYEQALEHFQAAQTVDPGNQAARQGEQQVRAAMEQLHMREGRANLAQGKQSIPNNVAQAAQELTAALGHFEAVQAMNPQNKEAAAGAEEARRLLPDVLARQGKREQQAGESAEPQSATAALPHYEEAQSAFQGALEIAPQHAEARQGLEQVQQRLAQLRQRLEDEANRARQTGNRRPPRTLEQLLGQVQESDRERQEDPDRQRQQGRNTPQARKNYPDW